MFDAIAITTVSFPPLRSRHVPDALCFRSTCYGCSGYLVPAAAGEALVSV